MGIKKIPSLILVSRCSFFFFSFLFLFLFYFSYLPKYFFFIFSSLCPVIGDCFIFLFLAIQIIMHPAEFINTHSDTDTHTHTTKKKKKRKKKFKPPKQHEKHTQRQFDNLYIYVPLYFLFFFCRKENYPSVDYLVPIKQKAFFFYEILKYSF